ncbi:CHC2 zinc finger domain-containing protein [Asticcacaulis sp. W401b]|uniref:CHC2 zinc finger domain-containing protein n=1 Tax=Asticcacaulis sp. W401b TaxID=3388666 RepID=UPI003970EB18
MSQWRDEVARLNIVTVAEKLGLQIAAGRKSPRVALCPFHNDSSPSLHLYQGENPHYHCFVCHEHGDTVELVKKRRGVEFSEALQWLETNFGIVTSRSKYRAVGARLEIMPRALSYWRERASPKTLKSFADARKFTTKQLSAAGITVGSVEDFIRSLHDDREAQEAAVAAGLAFENANQSASLLKDTLLSPFVRGAHVLIPLANSEGRAVGVMARSLLGGGPKYKFTSGFQKSTILYRADHIKRQLERSGGATSIDGNTQSFDLCVCEGVFDALRLESLEIPSVALLGTSVSEAQLNILSQLAELSLQSGRVLRLHVFLDSDAAGRRGLADCLPRLLERAAAHDFLVDVVAFDVPRDTKADPDILFQNVTEIEARTRLSGALISVMDALSAIAVDQDFSEAPAFISSLDAAGSIILQNRLARRLQKLDWPRVWRRLAPHRTSLSAREIEVLTPLELAYERIADHVSGQDDHSVRSSLPEPFSEIEKSDEAALLHALILARESTDSREYPVDVAAWDRLEDGAQVFLPLIKSDLGTPSPPKTPYLAHYEAKDSGAPRLKCGPCPEEAVQQQYVLSELLKVRPEREDIARQIPAVRYWADHPSLIVTGVNAPKSAVSFAYQIDMRALEERPDRNRRRDMFRPFLDCWNSFILHIGNRIERMRSDLIYIARLDVKGFYDNVPRFAIERILDEFLPESDTLDVVGIAQMFGADSSLDRRHDLKKWILDHSFGDIDKGYSYFHPGNGEPVQKGGSKGIPQGPALSAYLANIVLFGLDAELEQYVQKLDGEARQGHGLSAFGGVYARYVDDIIIAARRPEDLQSLRALIEMRLEPLGLELNEKSEHLDPMTAQAARDWLVERRGAGFVAYGEIEDQPSPAPDVRTGWSDIPTLDRRSALSLLYWSALDDPSQTNQATFDDTLEAVARADGIRSTDLSHIARRIFLRAALNLGAVAEEEKYSQFFLLLHEMFGRVRSSISAPEIRASGGDLAVATDLREARYFLAALAGLERLVMGNPEHNPTFAPEIAKDIAAAKALIIEWLLDGRLLSDLQRLLIQSTASTFKDSLQSQIEVSCATLEERAARLKRLFPIRYQKSIGHRPPSAAPSSPAASCIRIGWFRTFAPQGLTTVDSQRPIIAFHAIAAAIQAESETGDSSLEATVIAAPTLTAAMAAISESALNALVARGVPSVTADIAHAFRALTGNTEQLTPELQMRALTALIALSAGPNQAQTLQRRPELLSTLSGGGLILPLPPIAGQPGLFCYHPTTREVRAIIVASLTDEEAAQELPAGLSWNKNPSDTLTYWTAILPRGTDFLFDPLRRIRAVGDEIGLIAEVFTRLVERYGSSTSQRSNLVHVFSLLGPSSSELGNSNYLSLSWSLDRATTEQLIFERRGNGLAIQRSPHAGTHLWRIGQAVADLFAIHEDGGDADVAVKSDSRLLQDRLKRMAFSRLRGRWINGVQVASALAKNSIPRALERIIGALRETADKGDQVGPLALEFFLTGRAMRTRMQLGSLVDVAGGWSRYLELVGSRSITPGDDEELFSRSEIRENLPRTSRALARIADSVQEWSMLADQEKASSVLSATSAAFEINAFRTQIRDMALGIFAMMSATERNKIKFVRPALGPLESFGELVFFQSLFQGTDVRRGDFDTQTQGAELFSKLGAALTIRQLQGRAILDRISTVGWLVILCVATGALDFEMADTGSLDNLRERLAFPPVFDPQIAQPLVRLAVILAGISAAPDADPEDWPWEIAEQLPLAAIRKALSEASLALGTVGKAVGVYQKIDPLPLRTLTTVNDTEVEFVTSEGETYKLPWWRCTVVTTSAERIDRTETVSSGERLYHPYSALLSADGRVLIIQVISESLAAVSGLKRTDDSPPSQGRTPVDSSLIHSDETAIVDQPHQNDPAIDDVDAGKRGGEAEETEGPDITVPPDEPQPARVSPAQDEASWRERQIRSWRARAETSGLQQSGYGRIALLQYDFEDSYYPLKVPNYRDGSSSLELPRVTSGVIDYKLSFEEHRRRQVLRSVLECCKTFGVEILLLPEVSLRPETINWLSELCETEQIGVSIWAGSFRQQPSFGLNFNSDNSKFVPVAPLALNIIQPAHTVVSVIFRETQPGNPLTVSKSGVVQDERPIFSLSLPQKIEHRKKKYPSIGMDEDFRPYNGTLEPIMNRSRSVNRIESYVSELVCSELFVFNGPLNWVNLVSHLETLNLRYEQKSEKWIDSIISDAKEFANVFSGDAEHRPRRSILLLTCATSRDADYHTFAQSAYLSSGIISVFCNATHAPANGGSCFIGPGGWETQGRAAALPGPYHGILPGILTSTGKNRGALGTKENALVIADIRPDRTVDDKPRSQTLGAPMKLVAHIPIIEDQVFTPVEDKWNSKWWKARKASFLPVAPEESPLDEDVHDLLRNQLKDQEMLPLDEFAQRFSILLDEFEVAGKQNTLDLDVAERSKIISLAIALSGLFKDSPSMRHRAEALIKGAQSHPERMPCAALIDWLVVKLDISGFREKLVELSKLKGEVQFSDVSPALRTAPWAWCPPEAKP